MRYLLGFLAVLGLGSSAFGVATVTSGTTTYQTSEPTGVGSTTGWDYVGSIAGASGVYLGNGWVITCAHVLSLSNTNATFTLGGVAYSISANSIQYVVSGADLVMFHLSDYSSIALSTLALATQSPGGSLYLFGYGGGQESWGTATVSSGTYTQSVTVNSSTYSSVDFQVQSTTTELVTGDSGGGAFSYDAIRGAWTLTGLLEATGTSGGYYIGAIVDVAAYTNKIETIMATAVPEPATWALAAMGFGVFGWSRRRKLRRQA